MNTFRQSIIGLTLAALVAVTQGGCAALPGGDNLAVSPEDPCGAQRQAFANTQNFFAQEIAVSALRGGLAGGAAGAVIGGATGGTKGALIGLGAGVLTGAAIGAASGYWSKLQQQQLDQQQLALEVNGAVTTESAKISETAATFSSLRGCRFATAQRIKYQAARGSLPRADAESQLAQEHAWFDQEVRAAQNAGLNMRKRDEQFQYAANNLQQQPQPTHRVSHSKTSDPATTAKTTATETIPQKRNSFDDSVSTAQAQSSSTFTLDTSTSLWDSGRRHA
jgi:hypothetical protein